MTTEVPHFPRGFILANGDVPVPDSYVRSPFLPHLWVHPWLKVDAEASGGRFVIVLGLAIPLADETGDRPSQILLSALSVGDAEFFEALMWLSGRYAIIYGDANAVSVVADATGMRSVFYATDAPVIASHAHLVEQALGRTPKRDGLPFQHGYPGNRTPYPKTKILTPNTYLNVTEGSIHRFWPNRVPPARDVDDVARETIRHATRSMRVASMGRLANVALTGGLDSRVLLALAERSGVEFETFTYDTRSPSQMDAHLAHDLAASIGVRHTLIPTQPITAELRDSISAANYASHHRGLVPGIMEWFGDPRALALTCNLLEIGRLFYAPTRDAGALPPATAEDAATLHWLRMAKPTREKIEAAGVEGWMETAQSAFEEFFTDTSFGQAAEFVDPFDLFYWEHRMGAWHGPLLLERDYYGEPFIPFNARGIFEALLGVSEQDRIDGAVFYRMIEMLDPGLLDFPVNPRHWPPKGE